MPQAHSNGIDIEYECFGNRRDPAILLIAGLGQQLTMWTDIFCQNLSKQGYYVIRFDNRDIGLSTKCSKAKEHGLLHLFLHQRWRVPLSPAYTLNDMACDAAGLLEALDIGKAHIIGASMGGMIAQLIAVNYPEKVLSLVSIMSTSGAPSLPQPPIGVVRKTFLNHLLYAKTFVKDKDKFIRHSAESLHILSGQCSTLSQQERENIVKKDIERSIYPHGFKRQFTAIIADGDRTSRLKTIRVPTLVIHGREDPLFAVECGHHTAQSIPNAQFVCLEQMGHDLPAFLYSKIIGLISNYITHHQQPELAVQVSITEGTVKRSNAARS